MVMVECRIIESIAMHCKTCWTVEFPPLRIAIPSFNVEATIRPISPDKRTQHKPCVKKYKLYLK